MQHSEPVSFRPLFFERVWGGRHLEKLYAKPLPAGVPIGESWEMVDREDAQSLVDGGPLDSLSLHQLWTHHREEIFGRNHASKTGRFPLLIKLLDAREKLSVQVHPPASVAEELRGEPKTEMWVVAHAEVGSDLYAGLTRGTRRSDFEKALHDGTVQHLIHRIPTTEGATMFIPSGRIHAIGGGNVIVEVQQNSDTTYRVFDWNRTGLDGKPRELHIEESMRSIDFEDFEPGLEDAEAHTLVDDALFKVERWELTAARAATGPGDFAIFCVLHGKVQCGTATFAPGAFFLVPAAFSEATVGPVEADAVVLRTTLPAGRVNS